MLDGSGNGIALVAIHHRLTLEVFADSFRDGDFRSYFRMSKFAMRRLHEVVGDDLKTGRPEMGTRSCGHDVSSMQVRVTVKAIAASSRDTRT